MKLFNQKTSYVVVKQAIYSASIVDKAMQDCFLLLHFIALSLSKKTYPKVNLN